MALNKEYKRRLILPLGLGAVAAFYIFVFQPLADRADRLDDPLQQGWKNLAAALEQTNATAIDFRNITNQLGETRTALSILDATQARAVERLKIAPEVKAHMLAPFELVEFENERGRQLSSLARTAAAQGVTISAGVYGGFPQHTAEIRDPALLWPALAFTDGLFKTLLRCKVTSVQSFSLPVAFTNYPPADLGHWQEIPLEIEFSGAAASVMKVLQSLPLKTEELAAAGLPQEPRGQTPLLIERIVLRKESPAQPDEVRAWLRLLGFVIRTGP